MRLLSVPRSDIGRSARNTLLWPSCRVRPKLSSVSKEHQVAVVVSQHAPAKRFRRELDTCYRIGHGVEAQAIQRMRGRIAECRQLAAFTTDRRVSKILLQMADEADADLRRFEAKSANKADYVVVEMDNESDA